MSITKIKKQIIQVKTNKKLNMVVQDLFKQKRLAIHITTDDSNNVAIISIFTYYNKVFSIYEIIIKDITDFRALIKLLESPNVLKIFYNAKDDMVKLYSLLGIIVFNYRCCTIDQMLLGSDYPTDQFNIHNLIPSKYKHKKTLEKITILINYLFVTTYNIINGLIAENNLQKAYKLEHEAIIPCIEMDINGIGFDYAKFIIKTKIDSDKPHIRGLIKAVDRSYNPHTKKLYTENDNYATSTARIISSNPCLQNISSNLRQCFVSKDFHSFIIGDYGQFEPRILAELSGDNNLIDIFNSGKDIYKYISSLLIERNYDEISNKEREAAKSILNGVNYGMGIEGLIKSAKKKYGLTLERDEAEYLLDTFYNNFPRVCKWQNRIKKSNKKQKVAKTILGRINQHPRPSYPQSINFPVQGTASEILKIALVELHDELPDVKGRLITTVYDSIIIEVPDSHVEEGLELLESVMVYAMSDYIQVVEAIVDVKVAKYW